MAEPAKQDVLPGHETQKLDEMNCPSCGRFVGAKIHCPYCGAKVAKRMSLVAIRYAAVLLATIGLVLLWAMAKFHDTPVVKIGDITPTMNFAQIRVDGTADSDVRTFRNGSMGFNISDGTGSLMVFISQKQGVELRRLGKLPHAGDAVRLNGTVSLSDGSAKERLRVFFPEYEVSLPYDDPPTYVPDDDPFLGMLRRAYLTATGDDCPLSISGGVSYSKVFGRCVTFGPVGIASEKLAHQKNERISEADCIRALAVYTEAMRLLGEV